MRVRSSPFAAGGGQGAAPPQGHHSAPLPAGQDDFFDKWDSQAEAPQASRPGPPAAPGFPPQQPVQHVPQQTLPQQPGMGLQGQMGAGANANAFVGAGAAAMGSMGINEAFAGAALNSAMAQMQNSQAMRWFPYLFMSLQQLFNVGHSYVLRKLAVLMCPFLKMKQAQSSAMWDDSSPGDISSSSQRGLGPDGLKVDVDQPDLYIPVMSYVTYVLIFGLQRGILQDFRPEVLPSTASFALVLLVLEVGAAKLGFYVVGTAVPFLDLMANCSYKFVPVTLMVIVRILTGQNPVYWVFFTYFAACAAWAVRRFLLHFEPSGMKEQYGVAPSAMHGHMILGLAIAQLPMCWLLTPSAAAPVATPSR
mmetsp:Transcript_14625/g.27461  ORF Transcript_14625/g.27461 Transcript_14625/m.27461 type:complete len:363 (-) Transcript_14625:28-1116(-)